MSDDERDVLKPPHEPDDIVAVQMSYDEISVQTLLKTGGRWDATRKLWWLRYHVAVGLGLIDRIID